MIARLAMAGLVALAVAGCSIRNPTLFNISKGDRTPDEFSIQPTKPLVTPADLRTLPIPTLGGANRTDPSPEAEAIIALGGNPAGGRGADRALVASVSRYGVQSNIRGTLATEDLDFRRRNDGRLLERLFNVTVYYQAYRAQSLDQYGELARLRRAGVRTVAAPPNVAGR